MPSKIDVRYVAKLARLALSDREAEQYARQLDELLAHVDALRELPTDDVEATAQVVQLRNVARDDVVIPGLERADFLEMVPEREGVYVRVPRIIGEE